MLKLFGRQSWLGAAVLVGLLYAFVGVVFALPATHALLWRRAAWVVSIVFFLAHAGHEHFTLRHTPRAAALNIAFAAALGAFGLAIAANIHSLTTHPAQQHRALLLAALALWPAITAVPAFLVGLAINGALSQLRRRSGAGAS